MPECPAEPGDYQGHPFRSNGRTQGVPSVLANPGHLADEGLCPLAAHGHEGHGGHVARPLGARHASRG